MHLPDLADCIDIWVDEYLGVCGGVSTGVLARREDLDGDILERNTGASPLGGGCVIALD